MKILLCWSDSCGLDLNHEQFECKGDIAFEACDQRLWNLVQDGSIVSICKVDDDE